MVTFKCRVIVAFKRNAEVTDSCERAGFLVSILLNVRYGVNVYVCVCFNVVRTMFACCYEVCNCTVYNSIFVAAVMKKIESLSQAQ